MAEPLLAYGTDEDAGFFPEPWNMDPHVNRWDLGSEPLRFYGERVRLSEEVFRNVEARLLKPGEGYQVLRRSFQNALFQSGTALALAAKYVGGVSHRRDHVGDPGGRVPFEPVPRARQEAAGKGTSLEINSHRRALQREHLRRLTGLLLRGENNPPEDARTAARSSLETLRARIRGVIARPTLRMPDETRSHLQESLSRIEEALKAGVQRQAL